MHTIVYYRYIVKTIRINYMYVNLKLESTKEVEHALSFLGNLGVLGDVALTCERNKMVLAQSCEQLHH